MPNQLIIIEPYLPARGAVRLRSGPAGHSYAFGLERSLDEQQVETAEFSDRFISLLRVATLLIGDRRELCLIRNVSGGGMLIRAYSAIEPGTRVTIELKQGDPVHGTTLSAQDNLVSVSFDAPIDVVSLITASSDVPRHRMPRLEVCCTAWLREGAIVHRTRVLNISQGGLRIETKKGLTAGAQVTVTLPGLPPEQGVVKWTNRRSAGITFNRVLALPKLVGWIAEQQERQRVAS